MTRTRPGRGVVAQSPSRPRGAEGNDRSRNPAARATGARNDAPAGSGADSHMAPVVPVSPSVDTDHDGIPNNRDNCATVPNPAQLDCNQDQVGNACSSTDCDGDGIEDRDDNCPSVSNPSQANSDGDGL